MKIKIELGSEWVHKKKLTVYRVTEIDASTGDVYLKALSKGARSTWKYGPLVPWDYSPAVG